MSIRGANARQSCHGRYECHTPGGVGYASPRVAAARVSWTRMTCTRLLSLPAIQARLCDVAVDVSSVDRAKVHPGSRVIEDLHCDSLAFVDLLMRTAYCRLLNSVGPFVHWSSSDGSCSRRRTSVARAQRTGWELDWPRPAVPLVLPPRPRTRCERPVFGVPVRGRRARRAFAGRSPAGRPRDTARVRFPTTIRIARPRLGLRETRARSRRILLRPVAPCCALLRPACNNVELSTPNPASQHVARARDTSHDARLRKQLLHPVALCCIALSVTRGVPGRDGRARDAHLRTPRPCALRVTIAHDVSPEMPKTPQHTSKFSCGKSGLS
jgi:hypothetical protein